MASEATTPTVLSAKHLQVDGKLKVDVSWTSSDIAGKDLRESASILSTPDNIPWW